MKKRQLLNTAVAAIFMCAAGSAYGQGMAVNTTGTAANASAMLDVSSTTQGVLIPRMLSTDRTAIGGGTPPAGLLVYQTDGAAGFYFYDGSVWKALSTSTSPTGSAGGDLAGSYPNPTISSSASTGANVATALNASSSTVAAARLGSGTASANTLLHGNQTWSAVNLASSDVTGNLPTNKLNGGTGAASTTFWNGSGVWSAPFTLTTAGSSGAATFTGGVLNIPTPAGGGSSATGASPSGIPYSIHGRPTTSTFFYSPSGPTQTTTLGPTTCSIAPTTCTPSMSIYTLNTNAVTWNLKTITIDGTGAYIIGTTVASCATSASSGGAFQTCTATAAGTVAAGTLLSLVPSVTPTGTGGFYLAFSCQ